LSLISGRYEHSARPMIVANTLFSLV
jgi:hypothetical protein